MSATKDLILPERTRSGASRRRNAVQQMVKPVLAPLSDSWITPAATPAPTPKGKRDTDGLHPIQVQMVDMAINRAKEFSLWSQIGNVLGLTRADRRYHVRCICQAWDCTPGTIRDAAYLKGFSTGKDSDADADDSRHHFITFRGQTQTLHEWAAEAKIPANTLAKRLKDYKWTPERALTTGVRGMGGIALEAKL